MKHTVINMNKISVQTAAPTPGRRAVANHTVNRYRHVKMAVLIIDRQSYQKTKVLFYE